MLQKLLKNFQNHPTTIFSRSSGLGRNCDSLACWCSWHWIFDTLRKNRKDPWRNCTNMMEFDANDSHSDNRVDRKITICFGSHISQTGLSHLDSWAQTRHLITQCTINPGILSVRALAAKWRPTNLGKALRKIPQSRERGVTVGCTACMR